MYIYTWRGLTPESTKCLQRQAKSEMYSICDGRGLSTLSSPMTEYPFSLSSPISYPLSYPLSSSLVSHD